MKICNHCHQEKWPGQYIETDEGEILCAFCLMTNYEWVISDEVAAQSYDKVIVIDNVTYGKTSVENLFRR